MSVADGYLILGWVVDTWEIPTHIGEDGEWLDDWPDDVNDEVAEILYQRMGIEKCTWSIAYATWQYTYACTCDETFIGVELMSDDSPNVELGRFIERLNDNMPDYIETANMIYRAIMRREPEEPPVVFCVPCAE